MSPEANGHAIEERAMFRRAMGVANVIEASPEKIWTLLTDAANIPKWNSTVSDVSGTITLGSSVTIRVPTSKRLFKLKVEEFEPFTRLVFGDGNVMFRGIRTFSLAPGPKQMTTFSMVEVFTGLLLPVIGPSLPDFKPVFAQYAADLKTAAESQ